MPEIAALVLFSFSDQHCERDRRENGHPPVLKLDAQERELPHQPVVHFGTLGVSADTILTNGKRSQCPERKGTAK